MMGLVRVGGVTGRAIVAVLFAACVAGAGARAVATGFVPVREAVVRSAIEVPAGGVVARTVPSTPRPLSVVIARVRTGAEAAPLEVRIDAATLARVDLQSNALNRIDVQVPKGLVPGATLELSCASPGWSLDYLELANQHGFTSGILNASVVPRSRHDFAALPAWLMLLAGLFLAGIWTPPGAGRRPVLEWVLAVFGLLLCSIAMLAPLVSAYAVVLSVPTFLLCVTLVFGASIRRRYVALRARRRRPFGLDAAVVVAAIAGFFVVALVYGLQINQGDYTRFLKLSAPFVDAPVLADDPQLRASLASYPSGYDGQFMFLMAFDPLLTRYEPVRYRQVVDSPPYRYGRIGFSLLTRLFSGGDPRQFARTMLWLVVAGHAFAAFFLVMIARQHGARPWEVLPYVLIPGFLVSLGNGLPESIAAALLLGGLWAHGRSRVLLAVLLWAASLMIRETGAILILAVVLWTLVGQQERRRALALMSAFVPAVLWRAYVGMRLFPDFGWRAFWNDPADLTWPLSGFLELWGVNDAAHGHGQAFNTWFPLILVALLVLAAVLLRVRRTPVAAAAVAYGLLAVSLNYRQIWSWVGNGERGTFEFFLMALVAALPFRTLPRALRWAVAAFAVLLFAYDFQVATHASWFRSALVVFR